MPDSSDSPDAIQSPEPPPDAGATSGMVPPAERQRRYPRPWWLAMIRILVLLAGGTAGTLYVLLFIQALIHQTVLTSDRDLLSVPSILEVVPLTAAALWAIRDIAREWIAEERQRTAERRVPFAVQAEHRWRADLAAARARGDRRAEGVALGNIGFWLNYQGRDAEAEHYLTQALALVRAVGDRFLEKRDLSGLAGCALRQGDLAAAEALYREALAVALTLTREHMPSAHPDDADVLDEVADTYALVGRFLVEQRDQPAEGRRMVAEAEARFREEARLHELAAQAHWRGSYRRATESLLRRRALALAQDMRDLQHQYGIGR